MRIDIITCLPELLDSFLNQSILKRAQEKELVSINIHNLRDYAVNKHKQVDDYAYGTDAGMVLMIEPVDKIISALREQRDYDAVIYTTPDGDPFHQGMANRMSLMENIIILCGHYKGVDERVREHFITHEISIGDYVLSGGELPAAVITDALVRLRPGVLSDETSALTDSYQDDLLAPPVYTRPYEYKNMKVPDVLLSGDDKKIREWQLERSLERTRERRPELYRRHTESDNAQDNKSS